MCFNWCFGIVSLIFVLYRGDDLLVGERKVCVRWEEMVIGLESIIWYR